MSLYNTNINVQFGIKLGIQRSQLEQVFFFTDLKDLSDHYEVIYKPRRHADFQTLSSHLHASLIFLVLHGEIF